jgi:imidazole glycerol-phosphate synthase subunit HisH
MILFPAIDLKDGRREALQDRAITSSAPALKIPHMGWNTLDVHSTHPVLNGIDPDWHAYFVHSYHMDCTLPEDVIATSNFGGDITAVVGYENLIGTQFHPEKSQRLNLRLIANFLKWTP